jgi:hypothetical protein
MPALGLRRRQRDSRNSGGRSEGHRQDELVASRARRGCVVRGARGSFVHRIFLDGRLAVGRGVETDGRIPLTGTGLSVLKTNLTGALLGGWFVRSAVLPADA